MAIDSYTTLQTAVSNWLDRTDSTGIVPDFISLAESRIYKDVRIRDMEAAISVTITGGLAAIPSDFLESKYFYINGSPIRKLEQRDTDWIFENYPTRSSDSKPYYYGIDGSNFVFGPYPDVESYVLNGTYYKRLSALSGSNTTNWFTSNAPDVLLFASLVEAAGYYDDPRIAQWEAKYQDGVNLIKKERRREKRGSGPIRSVVR
jgi:hypothetical protein